MTPRRDIRTRRRDELRRAAYETAGKHGFQTLTVAGIARRAGISKGIVHHYFDSKQDVIEHAVRFAHAQFRQAVLDRLRSAKSPSERLWSIIAGNFAPAIFEPRYQRLWLSIFEAARTDPRLARLCAIVDRRTVTNMTVALRNLVPQPELETTAFSIMALMDGCWFLAVEEPQITRPAALKLIAKHIQMTIPSFDMSAVKLESLRTTPRRDIRTRRRDELRRAAYETAGQHGFQALTVAGVARRAGISKGIIHHYFVDKQDLIEHTVRFAHAEYRKEVVDRLRKARSPSEKLWSIVDGTFAPALFQLPYRRLWLSIFEAAKTDPCLARLCAVLDRRSVTNMTVVLRHLVPPSEVETVGLSIGALMDGCYLLAIDEPQVTRSVALNLIANHIQIIIPNFDMSAVKLDSPSEDKVRRKR